MLEAHQFAGASEARIQQAQYMAVLWPRLEDSHSPRSLYDSKLNNIENEGF